jgi:hypothetical protein
VREDGRIVGRGGWQGKVHNREESSHSAHFDGMNELQNNAKTHDITTLGLKITSNFYFLRHKYNLH